jgi:hypothetical protein
VGTESNSLSPNLGKAKFWHLGRGGVVAHPPWRLQSRTGIFLPTSLVRLPPPPLSRASAFRTISIFSHSDCCRVTWFIYSFQTSLLIADHHTSISHTCPFRSQLSEMRAVPRCHNANMVTHSELQTTTSVKCFLIPSARDWAPGDAEKDWSALRAVHSWRSRRRYKPPIRLG